MNSDTVNDVIVTSGNNFPDALSASVLANKMNAPILLVDSKVKGSSSAFSYISLHLSKTGTVHIIGGTGIVGTEFETRLNQMGYTNIDRIGGNTRYDTSLQIAEKLNFAKNTPVVIASGENFPDALTISSIASSKGYPILLVSKSGMSQGISEFIANDQPTQVYIIGGTAVVPDSIKDQVQSLAPSALINRLAGQDRFDTAGQVLKTFSLNPLTIYLASGMDFPDALAGSALASQTGDPIVLINPSSLTVPPAIESYLKQLQNPNIRPRITVLGGTAVVPDIVIQNVQNILDGYPQLTPTQLPTTAAMDALAQKTGMKKDGFGNYILGESVSTEKIQVNIPLKSPSIDIYAWNTDQIKSTAKQLFEFFLPTQGDTLYSMVDKTYDNDDEYLYKTYTMDGNRVEIMADKQMGALYIYINL